MGKLLSKIITPEAVEAKINYAKKHNMKEDVWFYSNLENNLEYYAKQEAAKDTLFDNEVAMIKHRHNVLIEFTKELMNASGQLVYNQEFKNITQSKIPFLQDCISAFPDWQLKYTSGEVNGWCYDKSQCIRRHVTVYQLENKEDGTTIEFDLPDEKKNLHVYMFHVKPNLQNRGIGRKNFCKLIKIFFNLGMQTIYSPCLTADMPEKPLSVKTGGGDFRFSFRYKTFEGIKVNNLGFWYERLGGFFLRFDNMNENNIYFFSPELALEHHEQIKKEYNQNPWKHLECNGIYNDEVTRILNT